MSKREAIDLSFLYQGSGTPMTKNQEIALNDAQGMCLSLIDDFNKGKSEAWQIKEEFVGTWSEEMAKEWLYKHYDIDPTTGKQLPYEVIEKRNLEFIKEKGFKDIIVGFSGGKDSVATAVKVCKQFADIAKIHVVFCDTGNESSMTYDYVDLISRKLGDAYGIEIKWLKPDRYFMDLVKHKGMFPVNTRRFCTDHLKLIPLKRFRDRIAVIHYIETNLVPFGVEMTEDLIVDLCNDKELVREALRMESILMCQGLRRSESLPRRHTPQVEYDSDWGVWQYRPLCYEDSLHSIFEYSMEVATLDDVVALYKKNRPIDEKAYQWGLNRVINFGYAANPHYALGFTRLGCAPCFMSRKMNVRLLGLFSPDKITEIKEVEREIDSTFFWRGKVPERFHNHEWVSDKGKVWSVATIDAVVKWSNTKPYARNSKPEVDLFANLPCPVSRAENLERSIDNELNLNDESCTIYGGLCE